MFTTAIERQAVRGLSEEFPDVPVRIVAAVFVAYFREARSLDSAIDSTRSRIADAVAA